MYEEVVKIAKETDGHRLLRVMEIFARVETELKYSTSQRILFETAVLKASMPQEDYDIEGLLARIAALEEKIAGGVVMQKTGDMVEMSEPVVAIEQPVRKAKEQPKVEEVLEDDYSSYDIPPDELETGGSVYFDAPITPKMEQLKPVAQPMQSKPVVQSKPATGDAKTTFGAFLRNLRRTAKNGVLVTMCMDLDYSYEEGVLVLSTQSDTVYRSLKKDEHYALITQGFADIGVEGYGFDIRLRGKPSDDFQKKVEQIKETFGGIKVDVK
jgi:DNA polymerase III gamma/tau subunit